MSNLFHVTARDHGALVLMAALAEDFASQRFVSLQDVADQMHLSQGYLEEIAAPLKKAGLIQGRQGPGGGYRLAQSPKKISLEQILTAIEGPVELVSCQSGNGSCPVSAKCASKNIWKKLQHTIQESLRKTTLEDVIV